MIRLAYAKEGVDLDGKLTREVHRALAYYLTAYREVTPFSRKVPRSDGNKEMNQLQRSSVVESILEEDHSRGMTMKHLYENDEYLKKGFLFEEKDEEKIQAILDLCLPAFDQTVSIVVLHCITGLHALVVLKEYFDDFSNALDIYTTAVITHLLTMDGIDYMKNSGEEALNWEDLLPDGALSKDVHTIKFTYTCRELGKLKARKGLRISLRNQINK